MMQSRANSKAYEDAAKAHSEAFAIFNETTRAFRARDISDDEYLAARAVWDAAAKTFDDAFTVETRA